MACPEMRTKDDFEYQLGVNHIGKGVETKKQTSELVRLGAEGSMCTCMHLDV